MPKAIPDRPADREWEELLGRQLPRGLHEPQSALPGQRWATPEHLGSASWQYQTGGIFLGFRDGKAVGRTDDRHVFVVAGSRSGKGVSVILPNACLWPGSLVVVDPKGDVAKATARTRARELRQAIYTLDPFERTREAGLPLHAFNPLEEIYPAGVTYETASAKQHDAAIDNAELIADGLIIPSGQDQHWTDSARLLLKGLILYTLTLPEARNLVTVRELLMLKHPDALPDDHGKNAGGTPLDATLWTNMACSDAFEGLVESIGHMMLSKPDKERSSIRSTAIAQTTFLESPALKPCLAKSSFRLADLKRKQITVYLCLPANRMGTHARWLRVVINMMLHALEETPATSPHATLLCLDEFNVLGKMPRLSDAAGQMAGFGCKLMVVLQDITQLQEHYRHSWETFVGNSGLFITFGNSDVSTLDYISKKLGTTTVQAQSSSAPGLSATLGGASGISNAPQTVPLLSPHEVERIFARERERMSVVFPGMLPMILRRCISHDDPFFKPLLSSTAPPAPPTLPTGGFRPKLSDSQQQALPAWLGNHLKS